MRGRDTVGNDLVVTVVNDIGMNQEITIGMNEPITTRPMPTAEALLVEAEAAGWPRLRVRGLVVRGGEVAWRQLVTLAGPEALGALAAALTTSMGGARAAAGVVREGAGALAGSPAPRRGRTNPDTNRA